MHAECTCRCICYRICIVASRLQQSLILKHFFRSGRANQEFGRLARAYLRDPGEWFGVWKMMQSIARHMKYCALQERVTNYTEAFPAGSSGEVM